MTVNGHAFRHVHVTATDCKLAFGFAYEPDIGGGPEDSPSTAFSR